MPPLELWEEDTLGCVPDKKPTGPCFSPTRLPPLTVGSNPVPSTYLNSKGTSGSGTFAVRSQEEVSPGPSKDDIYGYISGL